tara:strand:- start:10121 stop:10333 length:213 start_codon:yes stop_codon:yes gene_type:complete
MLPQPYGATAPVSKNNFAIKTTFRRLVIIKRHVAATKWSDSTSEQKNFAELNSALLEKTQFCKFVVRSSI